MATKNNRVNPNGGVTSFTEADIVNRISDFRKILPEKYLSASNILVEYTFKDCRPIRSTNTRRFDEVIQNPLTNVINVIEYKRGSVTKDDVTKVVYERGYIENARFIFGDRLNLFLIVGEELENQAITEIKNISKNLPVEWNLHFECCTTSKYARKNYQIFSRWAANRLPVKQIQQIAFSVYQNHPEWFDIDWMTEELRRLDGLR
ncbi:MAG: hypothetical protein F6K53_20130 [Moorea sp. SIO4A1]|uniref:hypothetical protein n=1 Tax=Moorena sp. SIO4A1 TaxID=2607835 RepID=UPI001417FBFE|nr:hypothetical protein [Moorena sp. SIO4A1]NEO43291.1 hypothetical protein [Moorena sp. SIO4A3]NEQ59580.1 hypothetical protein [Moorena sp. SIO4A1]